jgi:hypothetical protein
VIKEKVKVRIHYDNCRFLEYIRVYKEGIKRNFTKEINGWRRNIYYEKLNKRYNRNSKHSTFKSFMNIEKENVLLAEELILRNAIE